MVRVTDNHVSEPCRWILSVPFRVPGPSRPEPRPATDSAKHSAPQILRGAEDLLGRGLASEPGTSQKFTHELSCTPTCQPHIYADVSVGAVHQLDRGLQVQHSHVPEQAPPPGWFLPWAADLSQAERCLPGNGATLEEFRGWREQIPEMLQGINHGDITHLVEANPEAALLVVFQQQHDAAIEVSSPTRFGCDQELTRRWFTQFHAPHSRRVVTIFT